MPTRIIAALALLTAGCMEPISSDRYAVANASADTSHDAVVSLRTDGELFCSGTVVSERVVLTATHCLAFAGSTAAIEVVFGDLADEPDEVIDATTALQHPDWRLDTLADDIALLALARDAPVTALPLLRRALGPDDEGSLLTLIGFGRTTLDSDDAGLRRSGTAPITGVGDGHMSINGGEGEPSICSGDSGGPSLLAGQIAGVHSRASCSTLSIDTRVDVHVADFIDPFIAEHPAQGPDDGCSSGPSGGAPSALLLALLALLVQRSARPCRRRKPRGGQPRYR